MMAVTVYLRSCLSCGGEFTFVPLPQGGGGARRCEPCREIHGKEVRRKVSARWRERHRQKSRDYHREYQAKRRLDPVERAKAAERLRISYAANPQPHRERALAWARANPEKACALTQRRRARQAAAPGDFTVEEFAALCEAYDHRCAYCGCEAQLTRDHAIPLTRGGSNDISNIVPACRPCNASKGTRTAEEFLAARAA